MPKAAPAQAPAEAEAGSLDTPVLKTQGLEVSFDGFKAIRGVDFTLGRGELRFLIGPNGAGKTTLLDAICGKVKPSRGSIRFGGTDLAKLQEHRIAQLGIGRKFQAPSVFAELTVYENLELSLKQPRGIWPALTRRLSGEQRDAIDRTLETIGLRDKPKWTAGSLSHGEKQWLEIGMLLIQDPQVLLLDEPAAGMTDKETMQTGELLLTIASDRSIIVVEHDMEFVREYARTVTVMHEGQILREGSMDDIQNDDRVAEVYLGRRGERHA
ncbi:urea ABC transporter ATP-binding protein UrtD [Paenibacillus thermoaerophilus]|uniref:Urea ABC transporter ATP-binding protein UrtD n=1 Tax=Paenibacillus thermoaerophilus TaxID=1215385 RepID=A0ABW2V2Z0_9BACL|nr:urea ABC transporter ATP-binding protein UrtD [Paenibacillus thermoaerophilus]TMV18566.1 urea ABC transporter ATP-binding protein UrtD [Paenibacillus thermoaerophilus]